MNILTNKIKLHLATSPKEINDTLSHIHMTKEVCRATDMNILAIVPTKEIFSEDFDFIQTIPDEGLLIPASVWKELIKYKNISYQSIDEKHFFDLSNGKNAPEIRLEIKSGNSINYPSFDHIINADRIIKRDYIGINPKILKRFCDATGGENRVKLTFMTDNKDTSRDELYYRMKIEVCNSDIIGLVMPVIKFDD